MFESLVRHVELPPSQRVAGDASTFNSEAQKREFVHGVSKHVITHSFQSICERAFPTIEAGDEREVWWLPVDAQSSAGRVEKALPMLHAMSKPYAIVAGQWEAELQTVGDEPFAEYEYPCYLIFKEQDLFQSGAVVLSGFDVRHFGQTWRHVVAKIAVLLRTYAQNFPVVVKEAQRAAAQPHSVSESDLRHLVRAFKGIVRLRNLIAKWTVVEGELFMRLRMGNETYIRERSRGPVPDEALFPPQWTARPLDLSEEAVFCTCGSPPPPPDPSNPFDECTRFFCEVHPNVSMFEARHNKQHGASLDFVGTFAALPIS